MATAAPATCREMCIVWPPVPLDVLIFASGWRRYHSRSRETPSQCRASARQRRGPDVRRLSREENEMRFEKRSPLRAVACFAVVAMSALTRAQDAGTTLEEVIPPGRNFDKAEFRMWIPNLTTQLRGVVALTPGSNGDGRAQ